MDTFYSKVTKARLILGDLVYDNSSKPPKLSMVLTDGVVRVMHVPHIKQGERVDGDVVTLRVPFAVNKVVTVSEEAMSDIRKSNALILEEEGVVRLYKLKEWSGSDWLVWEVKLVTVID